MPLYDHNGNAIKPKVAPMRPRGPSAAYYSSAFHSRLRARRPFHVADWISSSARGVREILISQARDLHINLGEIRNILNSMARFSIGDGLKPRSKCMNEECAKEYDEYFNNWSKQCDVFSRGSFNQIQKLVSISMDRDGDIGVAWVEDSWGQPKLQLFESHRIETPGKYEDGKVKKIIDGVEFDKVGNIINYWVRELRPKEVFAAEDLKYRAIQADSFMLIFEPERAAQYRGISSLAHGLNDGMDIAELISFAKAGVKIREGIGLLITNESGVASPEDDPSYTFRGEDIPTNFQSRFDEDDTPLNFDVLAPGYVPRLKMNERVADLNTSRPGESFFNMIDFLINRIASGMGIPIEMIYPSKFHNPTGPAMRAIMTRAQATFDARANLIENKLCNPVWNWVIGDAINKGILRQTGDWQEVIWRRPPKFTIDAGRDSLASLAELKAGTETLEQDAADRGEDWKEINDQRLIEAQALLDNAESLKQKYGIELDVALGILTDVDSAITSLKGRLGGSTHPEKAVDE